MLCNVYWLFRAQGWGAFLSQTVHFIGFEIKNFRWNIDGTIHLISPGSITKLKIIFKGFLSSLLLKGKSTQFFLFHHWVRIGQTKTSFNRQFSPKRPEVGQIFILRSNFDQNKDHMTSKQVRGPSKNWHSASEGTLKTDIQQVRGPSKLTSCKWGDPQNWHRASEGTLKTDIQQVRGPSKLTTSKWGDPILTSSKWGDAILSRIKICRDLRTFWRSLGKKSAFLWNKKNDFTSPLI